MKGNTPIKKLLLPPLLVLFAVLAYGQSPELPRIRALLGRTKDSLRYVDALNRLAMLLYEKNADSTFYYARRAREVSGRLGYQKGETDALDNLGVFFDIKGNLQLALRYYGQAREGYVKLKDTANEVQTIMNIAMVYQELGRDDKAVSQFNTAMKRGAKLARDSIMALVIYNYILQYPDHFSKDTRSYYLARATRIATQHHDERTLIAINQLLADYDLAHGRKDEGTRVLQQAIDSALSRRLYYVSMDMLIDMGDRLAADNSARAADYYLRGLDISQANGYLIYSQTMARKLFDFYSRRHDSLTAAHYSAMLVRLHDDEDKINSTSAVDYLDYVLKDEQIQSLQLRSRYTVLLLALAVIACMLAAAIIIVIRQNLKRLRLLNREISGRNLDLRRTLAALEQSQAENTRMMQVVAHDLRNPIGGIASLAGMVLDDKSLSAENRELLMLIKQSSTNSLDLVSDLLQAHTQTADLKKEPVDIGEMLHYCVSLLTSKAEEKKQRIELNVYPFIIPASPEKLWRVISNLITNAIKFSPQGAVIRVMMKQYDNWLRIAVKDEGIGVPDEIKDKIFDMLTAAKRPGTAGEQPFGLGLAISKQIVEAHGGRIWFESGAEKGTNFFVELPLS